MNHNTGGRLVWNHSTHIPGLISVLERMIAINSNIQTVTPGVIGRTKAHVPKLRLKVSVPIRGGFKVIARQGKSVQEVFIVTNLNKEELEQAIAQSLV